MRILFAVVVAWNLIGIVLVATVKAAIPMLLFTGPAQLIISIVAWPWFAWIVATGRLVRN